MAQKRSMNILFTVRFVRRDKQKNSQHGRDFFFLCGEIKKEKKNQRQHCNSFFPISLVVSCGASPIVQMEVNRTFQRVQNV